MLPYIAYMDPMGKGKSLKQLDDYPEFFSDTSICLNSPSLDTQTPIVRCPVSGDTARPSQALRGRLRADLESG